MTLSDWDADALGDFAFTPERGSEGGGYDSWKCSEPTTRGQDDAYTPTPRPPKPVQVTEDMGLKAGPCGLYVAKRDVREAEEFEWVNVARCDCNGGRGRSGVDVCWSCGRKAER